MNRRHFLSASAASGLLLAADRSPLRAEVDTPLKVGLIGCGWYGMVNLRNLLLVTRGNRKVEIVGFADPDKAALDKAAGELEATWKQTRPAGFADYREMLKLKPDVVIVGSPDHWHALHAISAMQAGADVYCEKPICHTIDEGKAMLATARRLNRVVQVGTQRRSTPHVNRAKEFVRSGRLGTIGQVTTCCYYNMLATANPPDAPAPATLDWDLWVGPAPMTPFNPVYVPKTWRGFGQFANGIVGDMFVHMLDTARYLVGFDWPKTVTSTGGRYVHRKAKANVPDTQSIALDYGDFSVLWDHRTYGPADDPRYPWAVCLYGEKGVLRLDVAKWEFEPHGGGKPAKDTADLNKELADRDQDAQTVPAGMNHMKNFLDCVGSRKKPVADIGEGYISTASCLLGNVALATGRTLKFDAVTQTVNGDAEANALFRREYRKPWVYPEA